MSDEKVRSSIDAARDPAQPVLPTINPNAEKAHPAPEAASFHPAVYIAYVETGYPNSFDTR
jgi:hypothetical protein